MTLNIVDTKTMRVTITGVILYVTDNHLTYMILFYDTVLITNVIFKFHYSRAVYCLVYLLFQMTHQNDGEDFMTIRISDQ